MTDENPDSSAVLHNLKRKRTRERGNITRFASMVNTFTEATDSDEWEYCKGRLQDSLDRMITLDDAIHDLLSDEDYETDATVCEDYIDKAKRAIQKAARQFDSRLSAVTANLNITPPPATTTSTTTHSIRLPQIKLDLFSGDIESWPRFWEQFETSIDSDPSIPPIHKHVFLRGYLRDEPKMLVEGISITAETYDETKKILQQRYGDKNRIVQAHLDFLENMKPLRSVTPQTLNSLFIDCNKRIQALHALGEDVNSYGRILAPKILRVFPSDMCQRWIVHVKRQNIQEADITQLMDFLKDEVDSFLTTQKIRDDHTTFSQTTPTAAALHVHAKKEKIIRKPATSTVQPFCVFCESRTHWAQDCKTITNTQERIDKLKATKRCFLCLNRNHNVSTCSKRGKAFCLKCKKNHHHSVCNTDLTDHASNVTNTTVGKIEITHPHFTYLQTARLWIVGPTGLRKLVRCVLDAGSQSTFISESLITQLQLPTIDRQNLSISAFESPSASSVSRKLVKFDVSSIWTKATVPITALESNHSFSPHPTVPRDVTLLEKTRKLKLADPPDLDELPIQLLIGSDHYWKIVTDRAPIRLSSSIVLLPSKCGWILSGNKTGITVGNISVNYINSNHDSLWTDTDFRHFWDLESMGITSDQPRLMSTKDSKTLQNFYDSYRTQDSRRLVSLLKKENFVLPNNYSVASRRLASLEKSMSKDNNLKEIYEQKMREYVANGHVEVVPPDEDQALTYYLPHHLVKQDKHGTTKYRIVFDGSAHEKNAPSLNDALEMGPNLLPETTSLLLRFRLWPVAIIGDISQAFLQLTLDPEDRNLTRFLWYRLTDKDHQYCTTRDVIAYRFQRLPFGLTCSPFLLSATLKELSLRHQHVYPVTAELLSTHIYMDDFIAGTENEDKAIQVYQELTSIMQTISLPMTKWATTSEKLNYLWKAEGKSVSTSTQVLGLGWNTASDTFHVDFNPVIRIASEGPTTKRQILRATASFYDPLGLMSLISITGKILFQDTWCRGIGWDELLPHDLSTRWNSWISLLSGIPAPCTPRFLNTTEDFQIHVFCDASERAYGAVLYIRVVTESYINVQLVYSKNRLAPVKRVTLPRLELLAALVGARILNYFCTETNISSTKATLWTDSMVVLGWVQNNPNQWKTFVCNRVTEIHNSTNPSQWKHCPGIENPADFLSRGVATSQIVNLDTWWHGPPWLSQHPDNFPNPVSHIDVELPEKKLITAPVLIIEESKPIINPSHFSSLWKLLRITAWVFRFIHSLKSKTRLRHELTADEIQSARTYWIQAVQKASFSKELHSLLHKTPMPSDSKIARFNPFFDDGFLRLGGRLHFSDLSHAQRHPILLDGRHHFTQLLIRDTHIRLHHLGIRIVLSELRDEFWILRARQTVRHVLHKCLPCKMVKNQPPQEIEPPLPSLRVRPLRPFTVTGADFAGPLYVRTGGSTSKSYIILFTCATVRAIHLELCTDMSTDKFLLAFDRFVSRRGVPHTLYTDNAQTFQAANKELLDLWQALDTPPAHQYFARQAICWKFIAPRAAWWGGWWERMVGSTKRCLRKVLGRSCVTEDTLHTIIVKIEAALNSRPITQCPETGGALTPSHFLVGEKLTSLPSGPEPTGNRDLTKEFRLQQQLADHFWSRWTKEYLTTLKIFHEVHQPSKKTPSIRVGDVVLLQEDVRPRHMWKRAIVEELRKGRDGKPRSILLRTPEGNQIIRPVQLVIPLEVDQGGEDVGNHE